MGAKRAPPRETHSEHQRFVQRLQGRRAKERKRLQKEHADFLAGYREADADFDVEYSSPPALTLRPFPLQQTGKDVAYLKAQKRLLSQLRRAVAAKTMAGSGKKAQPRRKTKSIHEEFVLELETDDEEEDDEDDEDYEEEMGHDDDEKELEEVVEMLSEATKAKGKSKAQRQPRSKAKTLRKPAAAQLAKEDKEARRSAAEQRCISSLAAELEDGDERERAKKKIAEAKKTKKKAERLPPSTPPQSSPVQHGQDTASQARDDTTFENGERCVHEQPNHTTGGTDESTPTQSAEYEVLNSDCKDTETEIGFYDDDEELQRVKDSRQTVRANMEGNG